MATRKYDKLTIEEFGAHLLEHLDLDPIYLALHRLRGKGWELAKIQRWLIAYWCFYHAGAACWLSEHEGEEYWKWMKLAAANTKDFPAPVGTSVANGAWPRGHERRHFRGAQGTSAVCELAEKYPDPVAMFTMLCRPAAPDQERIPFSVVSDRIRGHRSFGPWIAFKVGDMLEQVLGVPVDFTEAEVFMFEAPREAALMLWRERAKVPENSKPKDEAAAIKQVVEYLIDHFKGQMAPPRFERPLGLQEIETILCKWKSHVTGSYPLFNDIDEINEGLASWAEKCPSAVEFLGASPKRPT